MALLPANNPVSASTNAPVHTDMAIAMGLTVFAGFASTYYLRFFTGGPKVTFGNQPFTLLVHTHGALFTSWVLLFIVQTALVASHRVAVHRRMGIAGAALAAAMVAAGTSIAIVTAARGGGPPGINPAAFLVIPIFDMVTWNTPASPKTCVGFRSVDV